jgi:hypothetical protein
MRRLAFVGFAFLTSAAMSHEGRYDDRPKSESKASLIGKGVTPFNWTASFWTKAVLIVGANPERNAAGDFAEACGFEPRQ